MPSIDVRGHLVPNGSEPASRQSLLDFSQSVPSVKACDSETAAIQHINALKAAGVKITESNPVFVWRSDRFWCGMVFAGQEPAGFASRPNRPETAESPTASQVRTKS